MPINISNKIDAIFDALGENILNGDEREQKIITATKDFIITIKKMGRYSIQTWNPEETWELWIAFDCIGGSHQDSAHIIAQELNMALDKATNAEKEPIAFTLALLDYFSQRLCPADIDKLSLTFQQNAEIGLLGARLLEQKINIFGKTEADLNQIVGILKKVIGTWGYRLVRKHSVNAINQTKYNNTYPFNILTLAFEYDCKKFALATENHDLDKAQAVLNEITNYVPYQNSSELTLPCIMMRESLTAMKHSKALDEANRQALQHMTDQIDGRINNSETKFKDDVNKIARDNNQKTIENLGVFSAIITFIITAALAMFKAESAMSPIYMITIGLILIVFILTIQLTTNTKKTEAKDQGVVAAFKDMLLTDKKMIILSIYTILIAVTIATSSFIVEPRKQEVEKLIASARIELNAQSTLKLEALKTEIDKILTDKKNELDNEINSKTEIFKTSLDGIGTNAQQTLNENVAQANTAINITKDNAIKEISQLHAKINLAPPQL